MKISKNIIIFLLLAVLAAGCASVPTRPSLPLYSINGISYVPLTALCESRGIRLEYDSYSRTVNLSKNSHRISFMVGDRMALVDGVPEHFKNPIDLYKGAIVVPYKFKEQVIDVLFKEREPSRRTGAVPLTRFKTIVVDPGHGGTDPGAIGRSGIREKLLTLDFAKRLAKLLKDDGFKVVMTRSSDTFIALPRRVDIANNSKSDLFVSIHVNANRVRSLNGFEVYYITPNVGDSKRAVSAAEEHSLGLDRSCFASNSATLKAILWDMIYTYQRAESIELAHTICRSMERDLEAKILGVKGANFYVLRGVQTPAILIEVGYLSNTNEERMLKNTSYRQQVVEAIEQGIRNYVINYPVMEASK